ncbi:MAG: HD domain-containing phosphohydrolase [Vicinamibacterales bacterium]
MSPAPPPRVWERALVIDPDARWSHRLGQWLARAHYRVTFLVPPLQEGHPDLATPFDVVLCDSALFARLSPVHPLTAVLLMTTSPDVAVSLSALRFGGVDCLVKPFDERRLRVALRRSRAWRCRRDAGSGPSDHRGQASQARQRIAGDLRPESIDSPPALDAALERITATDPAILAHGRRVAELVRRMAALFGLPRGALEGLTGAALVHDVPRLVLGPPLNHADGLRTADHVWLRTGPTLVRAIFDGAPYLSRAIPIALARYERWDGTGYPSGLRGESIPYEGRVLAVLDTFDTLLQSRPYRPSLSVQDALTEIRRGSGSQFDPRLVDFLTQVIEPADDSRSAA